MEQIKYHHKDTDKFRPQNTRQTTGLDSLKGGDMEGKGGDCLLLRPERCNKQMHHMNLTGSWFREVEGLALKGMLGTTWEVKYGCVLDDMAE